jgi:hypothetical protein
MQAICITPAPTIQEQEIPLDRLIRGHFQAISPQIGTFSPIQSAQARTGR